MPYVGTYKSYPIYTSNKPEKKYYAEVDGKKVYFGQYDYEHYFDKLGVYSDWDHLDPKRRKNFKKRFEKSRHKIGSASWFSDQILW